MIIAKLIPDHAGAERACSHRANAATSRTRGLTGYGVADAARRTAVKAHTLLQVAAVSKPVAAMGALGLCLWDAVVAAVAAPRSP
jgi:CubicO group peptidase (beta-lactamase class C family)